MKATSLLVMAFLSVAIRAAPAQVACEFGRNYVFPFPIANGRQEPYRASVAANFIHIFTTPVQRAVAGDVTLRVSRYVAVAAGVAYCDPRVRFGTATLNLPNRPIFGTAVGWTKPVSARGDVWLGVQAGASYVELDLEALGRQKETVIPLFVALGYSRGRLSGYGGGLVQYRHESVVGGSSESTTELGGVAGAQVALWRQLAIGLGYNLVRFEDPTNGKHGIHDKLVVRLEYAFGKL